MPKVIKGHAALIYYHDDTSDPTGTTAAQAIGYTESLTIDFGRNVDPFYEHGTPQPVELAEGNEEIAGSISRAWVNMDLLDALLVGSSSNYILPEFTLYVMARVYPTGFKYLYLYNVKFTDSSLDIPQDGFLMQDVDFRARSWGKVDPTA